MGFSDSNRKNRKEVVVNAESKRGLLEIVVKCIGIALAKLNYLDQIVQSRPLVNMCNHVSWIHAFYQIYVVNYVY